MLVIGLLSSEEEVKELKYIARVCTIEERIRFIIHADKVKKMLKEERQ